MIYHLCHFKNVCKSILIAVLISFVVQVSAQKGVPPYLLQTDWLEASDLKKWNKYLDQLEEADKLLIQSNDSYLEVASLTEEGADDPKKQKQIGKLEEEAAELYKQALIKYKEIYGDLTAVLTKYIGQVEEGFPAYTEMQQNAEQAKKLYDDCGKVESDSEREMLSRANELQLASLEKGISIFTVPTQESSVSPVSEQGSASGGDDLVLDNEMYQKYKRYVEDNSISDPIVISQLMQLEGDEAAFAAFEKRWQQYNANEEVTLDQKQEMAEQIIDSLVAEKNNSEQQDRDEVIESSESSEIQAESVQPGNITVKQEDVADKQNVNNEKPSVDPIISSAISASAGMTNYNLEDEFRVQVAASKTPLSISQVTAIYRGGATLIEFKEGSYYKYQIRGFDLYSDAQKVCSNSGVDNAYIAAYKKTNSISLAQAVKNNRKLEQEVKKYGRKTSLRPIDFTVQVAASRERLSSQQINQIYSGSEQVATIFEEGWYKYQILAGKDLQNAFSILENCGVKKAFIVAYKQGAKLNLYRALNEYKTYR